VAENNTVACSITVAYTIAVLTITLLEYSINIHTMVMVYNYHISRHYCNATYYYTTKRK